MGRPKKQNREPFWKTDRGCYYVQHGSKHVRLSPDRDEAWRLWHEFMAKPPEERKPVASSDPLVIQIIDDFLEWAKCNRSADTYGVYRRLIQKFVDAIPKTLLVSDLKPNHVTRVMDANAEIWNNNTKHDFATAVQRAFNWALGEGLIDRNPLAKISKPGREAREMAVSPADYADAMAAIKEPNFRMLLAFAWESGVRPQEIRAIEARHVDFEKKRIVFPPKEAKGKKRHRIVYLTDAGIEILKPLIELNPEGAVFRNSEGMPWNKNSINCAFCRLKEKIGRKLHMGAWRKGYATEALKSGMDTVSVAALLGHTNAAMVSRVYGQVQRDPEYMAELAERAKNPRK
jgi:integrase